MYVLVVYGDREGPARAAAVRLTRALRRVGTPARASAAGRVARLAGARAVVAILDASGEGEVRELLDSFGLPNVRLAVFAARCDATPIPAGVHRLPGTRDGGAWPRDGGAAVRSAAGLTAALPRPGAPSPRSRRAGRA